MGICFLSILVGLTASISSARISAGVALLRTMKGGASMGRADNDNHANQLNPNNDAYWQSRGWDERPDDWQEAVQDKEQGKK